MNKSISEGLGQRIESDQAMETFEILTEMPMIERDSMLKERV